MITIVMQLRYDYDPTTIQLRRIIRACFHSMQAKNEHVIFCRSHVVVVSQSNGTQIVISITFIVLECVMVSSYRSRIVIESQL